MSASSIPGYHGRYLLVDLSTREYSSEELSPEVLIHVIGGTGLGTWLLLEHCPPGVNPLSPEAPLAFVFSPLVGSPLTTSAKFAVMGKSPLTQRINDSLSSSAFAISGKNTGFDAIVIHGRSETPVWLSICATSDGFDVQFEDASAVWGQSASDTEIALSGGKHAGFRFAAIGKAGENLVRYATVSHDGRHAGRGGLGALMGSKNLKAIGVKGDRRVPSAHPRELTEYSRNLSRMSFGPATEKYREFGTVSNLLTFNRLGTLPTRNFQQGDFEGAEQLSPDVMASTRKRTRASCAACTIGCEHIFHSGDDKKGVRLEYENLFALGPLCGINDPDTVLQASRLCDEYGLDTISTGGTIAFAMECSERGLISQPQLRFGNGDALIEAILAIGERSDFGDELAEGSRLLSQQIGQGADAFAPHVKGLELPGYEPRSLQAMALGLAVGTRGADHNRSGAYQLDFSPEGNRFDVGQSSIDRIVEIENEAALMDSLILCKFLRGVFDDRLASMAEMLRLVTGVERTTDEMAIAASRLVSDRKVFNVRHGWTRDEDTLPERFFSDRLPGSEQAVVNRKDLANQISAYYQARGWDEDGVPSDVRPRKSSPEVPSNQ